MIIPQTPKGFRDFLPSTSLKRKLVLAKIVSVFERFGFDPLETPAIEFAETLKGKYGEDEKLIFEFTDRGDRQVALRYDQTVPLSRVVAQYPELPKPFKRYQTQNVWRAENPQKGRFREFLQVDFDVVGSSSTLVDSEIAQIISAVLKELGFKKFRILLNSRPLLNDLMKSSGVDENLVTGAITSIDKLKKIGIDGVIQEMVGRGIPNEVAKKVIESFQNAKPNQEVQSVLDTLKDSGEDMSSFVFEPTLARGLAYYTGIIYEAEVEGFSAGSVCGGGRYDKLIGQFSGTDYPANGASFGFDRVLEAMEEQGLLPEVKTTTKVLVTIFSKDLVQNSLKVAQELKAQGINTEVYLDTDAKLEKQLKYADAKGIPFAIILGPEEAEKAVVNLKNLSTKEQTQVPISEVITKLT
ncbi:MAG: histidine--tRNA ligase [Candidatus Woykebacteria bacterium RIFCSPHIGHO2_12_FULL_43_10]|uniref:Histidine--tRNA ligase n=1 Tax=Candidatus Woykebacteria bacterium RIFCSPHIGHO2_02_FULL_43_16b TaxID=1802601 RepID=A0A1G1WQK1_9BACT|nr:MAG: histidine--tRNA ligase [Candidatus Woykebacteria bacterium RIFCSPHIGHO2_01_FULL_43_29]OGY29663.1 MAG: histidine--tRNA ligase [Candidatus Woykebacteria bacterium RIFCSPHIGHO2_12_FULL_43_10]OGY29989.1 MAG: histidine--tRNA ligase [Candidatus Woykebacteria bacterium RIFCSPHIGHO2_02_FULL_43_16b]